MSLVTEMHASFQQLAHRERWQHGTLSFSGCTSADQYVFCRHRTKRQNTPERHRRGFQSAGARRSACGMTAHLAGVRSECKAGVPSVAGNGLLVRAFALSHDSERKHTRSQRRTAGGPLPDARAGQFPAWTGRSRGDGVARQKSAIGGSPGGCLRRSANRRLFRTDQVSVRYECAGKTAQMPPRAGKTPPLQRTFRLADGGTLPSASTSGSRNTA